ncbi:hypothetical protein BDV36DRAFT_139570 [Aspergillus pseudocaelatus]|uniref:Secreted protein n=1 Tax=Aspergillus pseudocaelatus TaxID=1825620 RepID=A0ABQ6WQE8_9EURO|nr:hypothetical protein BDV36DRAFT_139570 [Aspergillus pseudocaelatus]
MAISSGTATAATAVWANFVEYESYSSLEWRGCLYLEAVNTAALSLARAVICRAAALICSASTNNRIGILGIRIVSLRRSSGHNCTSGRHSCRKSKNLSLNPKR